MSALRESLADYLRIRRALGYKLAGAEQNLDRYLDYLQQRGERTISIENAVAFARVSPCPTVWPRRLTEVRGFARYMHAIDPAHQLLPADLLPRQPRRIVPYLYSKQEITALMNAAGALREPLRAATFSTLIGLLAVTGMRAGEAIGLDISDLDLQAGLLLIREAKFGKSRQLPLHASTVAALGEYLRLRGAYRPNPEPDAVFISLSGRRLRHSSFNHQFRQLTAAVGVHARSERCRPRPHDLRHSFAVNTLLDWYRAGVDVAVKMPLLSTYLGHDNPKHTYWYLQAAPELMSLAAARLESNGGAR
jgi:integrase/recombinase XerD